MDKKNFKFLCEQCIKCNGSCLINDIGFCPEMEDGPDIGTATVLEMRAQNEAPER